MRKFTNLMRLMTVMSLSLIMVVGFAQSTTTVGDITAPQVKKADKAKVAIMQQQAIEAAKAAAKGQPSMSNAPVYQSKSAVPTKPAVSKLDYLGTGGATYLKPVSNETYDPSMYPTPKQGGDVIGSATVISSLPYNNTGTTSGYINDYDAVCPYTGSTSPDVVYKFTPGTNQAITIDLCGSSYDTKLYVFENTVGNTIACNDDYYFDATCGTYVSALFNVPVYAGNTYYIIIDGYGAESGAYTIAVTAGSLYPVPPNDNCTSATVVSGPYPKTVTGTTNGATLDCPGVLDWTAVWYEVQLPYAVNTMTVDFCGTVYSGSPNYGIVYYTACNACPNYIVANTYNFTTCADGNISMTFNNVAGPGSIFFPAYISPSQNFTITFNVTQFNPGSGCQNTVLYPSTPTTVSPYNEIVTISTCNFAGEYAVVTGVQAGSTYQFTMNDLGTGTYITVTDGPPTGANVLVHGVSPVSWTATSASNLYVHYNLNSSCGTDGSCHVTTVQCTTCPPVPCNVTCPVGSIAEGELDIANEGLDVTNGGCNSTPSVFTPISVGDTYCGNINTYLYTGLQYRDTDWYRLDLSAATTNWQLTWTATGEFPMLIFAVNAGTPEDCLNYTVLGSMTATPCNAATLTQTVAPGVYYFLVMPSVFTGHPSGSGPSAGRWEYFASLTGTPLVAYDCNWTVDLLDTYGDGWNGGSLSVVVDGVPGLTGVTLASGFGPATYTFGTNTGSVINFNWTAGSWPEENYYRVYNHLGLLIYTSPIGTPPPATHQEIGDCSINANDVGAVSINNIGPFIPTTPFAPQATVFNFGSNPASFTVTMTITDGYNQTVNVTGLASLTSQVVTFPTWTPGVGTWDVTVCTNLAGDQNPSNNCVSLTGVTVSSIAWTNCGNATYGSYLGTAVGHNGLFYTIAGNSTAANELGIFNGTTWTAGAPLPVQRRVNASAASGGKIYHFGGTDLSSVYQSTAHVYNIATNAWSSIASLPVALGWHKAVAYGTNYIYVAGGYDGAAYQTAVYLYNISANTWTTCTPLPVGKIGGAFSLATGTNLLVYTGGASAAGIEATTHIGTIDPSNPTIITWTAGAAYPGGPMYRFDAAPWCDGKIIVANGSPSSSWVPASPNPTYVYEPATNTWTAMPNLPAPVLGAYVGSVMLAGGEMKLIVQSGYTGSAVVTGTQCLSENCETGYRVMGNVYYGVTGTGKPMQTNTTVTLTPFGTVSTGAAGYFEFGGVADGNYTLFGNSTKPFGGLQVLDAIQVQRFVAGAVAFTNLQRRAADVNLSSTVQNLDATFIRRRVGSVPVPQWTAPNFVFDGPFGTPPALQGYPVIVAGSDVTVEFRTLCSGDVNSSYTPPVE